MSLASLTLLLLLAAVSIVAYRRRRDRWYAAVALIAVLGVVAGGVRGVRVAPAADILDAVLVIVIVLVGAEAFGLPAPVTNRLGIGFRSREWEVDRELGRLLEPINRAIDAEPRSGSAPQHDAWQHGLLSDIDGRLERLDRLRAPTEEWSAVAAAYHDVYERVADAYRTGDNPAKRAEISALSAAVTAQRESLRTAYREGAASRLAANRMARIMRNRSAHAAEGGAPASKHKSEEGDDLG